MSTRSRNYIVPGLPAPATLAAPPPSFDTSASAELTRLRSKLKALNDHLNKMMGESQTAKESEAQVRMVTTEQKALDDLKGAEALSKKLQPEVDELEKHKKRASEELYKAIGPLMIDSLLRYLAVEQHPGFLLNPTWALARNDQDDGPIFNHYPSASFVKQMAKERKLTPALEAKLLEALRKEGDSSLYVGSVKRNESAHPRGERFWEYATALDEYMPGWKTAYDNFVDSPKGRAATKFGLERPYGAGRTKPWHEAKHWDESLHAEDRSRGLVCMEDRDQHPPRNKTYAKGQPAKPWFNESPQEDASQSAQQPSTRIRSRRG